MLAFEIPEKFMACLASGECKRYGTIIRDSKRIIGHIKETGNFSEILNNIPISFNPITDGVNVVSNITQNFQLIAENSICLWILINL